MIKVREEEEEEEEKIRLVRASANEQHVSKLIEQNFLDKLDDRLGQLQAISLSVSSLAVPLACANLSSERASERTNEDVAQSN